MSSGRRAIVAAAVVGLLSVGVAVVPGAASGAPGDRSPAQPAPSSGSAEELSGGPTDAPPVGEGERRGPSRPDDSALRSAADADPGADQVIEVRHRDGAGAQVAARIEDLGGTVHGPIADIGLEATLPAGQVAALEGNPAVEFVTEPTLIEPAKASSAGDPSQAVTGQELALTNADDWQAAGVRGAGVKVGIIDAFDDETWDASVASGDLAGAPAGTFCRAGGASCSVWSGGSAHGIGVAEIVQEMAPSATLYLATASTTADFQAAITYFHSQGVKIVTRSQTFTYDGPGDGTGGQAAVIDDAVSKGMLFLNSAGNSAGGSGSIGSYWRGPWTDADADGWLEFAPGDELLGTYCWYWNGLRWSDWGANKTDYDVYVFDSSVTQIGASERDQASLPPIEANNNIDCGADQDLVYVGIRLFDAGNGTAGDVLEFMVNGVGVEHWSNPYSAGGPGSDSKSPGALSVGAVDPASSGTIARYSSQGPTNDGRTKPDLAAPACVTSTAYSPNCFNGTSASTPVVAGAAALVASTGAATTPAGLASYLKAAVVDRGAAGADNVYGTGELRLRAPTPTPFTSYAAMVNRQFQDFLGRAPTTSERSLWVGRLVAGTHTRATFIEALRTSDENLTNVDPTTRMYCAYFLRIPDKGGLEYWIRKRRAGAKLWQISQSFATSSEFQNRYGSLTNAQFVDLIYENLFGRDPDPSGEAYWTNQLNTKRKNRGEVMTGFSESNEYKNAEVKNVNAAVGVIFMLKRAPTQGEFDALTSGAGTAGAVAEWAYASGSYVP